ncbi:MAG: single-stranded DNA-binding protein [bacterium]|nr:single-stranded DNA-binding protein [bacterium]
MSNYNKVILLGNLVADPDIAELPSGSRVANFRMAVNDRYRGRDGEMVEHTVFVDVKFFGGVVNVCEQYLSKGRSVLVDGNLRQDNWEDKETGAKRSKIYVFGRTLNLMPQGQGKGDTDTGGRGKTSESAGESVPDEDDFGPIDDGLDDF